MLKIGDEVLYNNTKYIICLFVGEDYEYAKIDNSIEEHTVSLKDLKPYVKKHDEVIKRLRTNEALEEDLTNATNEIKRLRYIITDSIRLLEKSERPFYNGIQMLKEMKNSC